MTIQPILEEFKKHIPFTVNEMKGNSESGSIGLWVDIGTEGFFKDFKVGKKE